MTRVSEVLLGKELENKEVNGMNKYTEYAIEWVGEGKTMTFAEKIQCLVEKGTYTDREYWEEPRRDLRDTAVWKMMLRNALDLDPGAYLILHMIRVLGARVEVKRRGVLRLLPGEIDAVTWDRLKREYLVPYRAGLVAVLDFCQACGYPIEEPERIEQAKEVFREAVTV